MLPPLDCTFAKAEENREFARSTIRHCCPKAKPFLPSMLMELEMPKIKREIKLFVTDQDYKYAATSFTKEM